MAYEEEKVLGGSLTVYGGDVTVKDEEGEEYVFYVRQQEEGRLMIMYQTPPL